jgi:hypothetical protein
MVMHVKRILSLKFFHPLQRTGIFASPELSSRWTIVHDGLLANLKREGI